MPISWQIPNAAKRFQEALLKGVPLSESRPREPVPLRDPRDRPLVAPDRPTSRPSRARACSRRSSSERPGRAVAGNVIGDER